ncbi:hypothetical protein TNCV_2644771 [Trichonephila clavipes]|nr:hypothetical protein TNCV_2644771 [Trichonephila clavipes]
MSSTFLAKCVSVDKLDWRDPGTIRKSNTTSIESHRRPTVLTDILNTQQDSCELLSGRAFIRRGGGYPPEELLAILFPIDKLNRRDPGTVRNACSSKPKRTLLVPEIPGRMSPTPLRTRLRLSSGKRQCVQWPLDQRPLSLSYLANFIAVADVRLHIGSLIRAVRADQSR